ncbi:helicase HerA domain-containing protein, partial [Methanoculleus bourgensis]|uniref:helicase HerA domain-containing protein n=1 Tax=Methanoculleus bourgensis TaxID=83986 RepID=UPI003B93BAD0
MGINRLCSDAPLDNNPIQHFKEFMKEQARYKEAGEYDKWRFVGYALELDYSSATIITSDPYKIAVGGIPRNSLLIMVPRNYTELPLHFTLLRVLESAPTPLSREVQQTYFDLQKRSMPELDVFTQSELQWGALKTEVLGMFYPNPENIEKIEFSSDINNFVSAHKYDLYAPSDDVLNVIINSMVPSENCFPIGKLRLTECRLPVPGKPSPEVEAQISTLDFMGTRTAMFGKTRLGKSNTIKIIAQSLIETTRDSKNVGQIIFDINGEYAN